VIAPGSLFSTKPHPRTASAKTHTASRHRACARFIFASLLPRGRRHTDYLCTSLQHRGMPTSCRGRFLGDGIRVKRHSRCGYGTVRRRMGGQPAKTPPGTADQQPGLDTMPRFPVRISGRSGNRCARTLREQVVNDLLASLI